MKRDLMPPHLRPLKILLLLALSSCATDPVSETPVSTVSGSRDSSRSGTLRLVTFNIHGIPFFTAGHRKRAAAIAKLVGATHADVVAFQEAFHAPDRELMCDILAKAGLPYHHYFRSGAFGSGLLTVSRHPITSTSFHQYSRGGNPLALRHADWWAGKGAGLTKIAVPGSGGIRIINTHLHARYRGDRYKAVRQSQLDELAAFVTSARSPHEPVFLLGDLNHTLSDPGWLRCIDSAGLTPVADQLSRIDYIMAVRSPDFSFTQNESLPLKGSVRGPQGDIPISDHTGVLGSVRIRANRTP